MGRQPREMQTEDTRNGAGRKARVPMNAMQAKLSVRHKEPGFQYRWVNDDHGRIANAQAAGYEFVEDVAIAAERAGTNAESDTRVSFPAGLRRDNTPMNTYLMKTREEFYNEDQAAKQSSVDQIDAAIAGGKIAENSDDNRYVPKGGISIKRTAQA